MQEQSDGIASTQTQVEIGSSETFSSLSFTSLTAPKAYLYNPSKFSPTPQIYFEASLKAKPESGSVKPAELISQSMRPQAVNGQKQWMSPYFITKSDDQYGYNTSPSPVFLTASDFGFYIPEDGIVTGIVVTREGNTNLNKNYIIGLTKDAGENMTGVSKEDYLQIHTDTTVDLGGQDDLWGTTWTPDEINSPNFGVMITKKENDSQVLKFDLVRVTVYYIQNHQPAVFAALYNQSGQKVSGSDLTTDVAHWSRIRSGPLSLEADRVYIVKVSSPAGNGGYISNAKLLIDQNAPTKIDKMQLVRTMVNTNLTFKGSQWQNSGYYDYFDPNQFTGFKASKYEEIVAKNSRKSGFSRLFDLSHNKSFNTAPTRIASDSFTRIRSGNINYNLLQPVDLVTQENALLGSTSIVSSSSLILDVTASK